MACYHPLKGFKIGVNPATGKDRLKIVPYLTNHVEKRIDGKYYTVFEDADSPMSVSFRDCVDIPCGRCIGCRLAKSREWANRCSVELSYYKYNYFITLTYDDNHLPVNYCTDPESGEVMESYTVDKRDWQLFMKRLRKEYSKLYPEEKLRFFMSAEYGDRSLRPHMHAIIFNLFIPDLKPYKKNDQGDQLYTSEWLNSFWTVEDPKKDKFKRPKGLKGMIIIGKPDWESIAYTARYVCKKLNGEYANVYEKFNIEPEFSLMSRNPGIGRTFYEENKQKIETQDFFYIEGKRGARPFSIPRYYRDLYYLDFPDSADGMKKKNISLMEAIKMLKVADNDLNYLDELANEEHNVIKRTKALKREL